jgi:hypothetical protein
MVYCILVYRISNPLIYISNACGVCCLFYVNAGHTWEESCNKKEITRKEGSASNAQNKVFSFDLLKYVFA